MNAGNEKLAGDINSNLTGNFTCVVSSHTVSDDGQAMMIINKNIVFVVIATQSSISDSGDPDSYVFGATGDSLVHVFPGVVINCSSMFWYVFDSRSGSVSITCSSI
mgnify:CR=1 FL=1